MRKIWSGFKFIIRSSLRRISIGGKPKILSPSVSTMSSAWRNALFTSAANIFQRMALAMIRMMFRPNLLKVGLSVSSFFVVTSPSLNPCMITRAFATNCPSFFFHFNKKRKGQLSPVWASLVATDSQAPLSIQGCRASSLALSNIRFCSGLNLHSMISSLPARYTNSSLSSSSNASSPSSSSPLSGTAGKSSAAMILTLGRFGGNPSNCRPRL